MSVTAEKSSVKVCVVQLFQLSLLGQEGGVLIEICTMSLFSPFFAKISSVPVGQFIKLRLALILVITPTTHPPPPGKVYLSNFQHTQQAEIGYGTSQPPDSLPKMLWLAMILLFWLYLSHFKSSFDCVKSKVGLFNSYNQSSYLVSHNLLFQKC